MGKFRPILTELSARDTPIVSFPDDNLCKCQVILTKLGTCIDIKEIWFGIIDGAVWFLFSVITKNTPIQIYRKFHLQKLKIFR